MKFNLKRISILLCTLTIGASAIPSESDLDNHLHPRTSVEPFVYGTLQNSYVEPLKVPPRTNEPVARYYELTLKKVKLSPDGFERTVWSVNGQYPAPIIQANKGDRLVVNVTNEFGDPTSVHWHGMFQHETNWYDGVPGQTQCPIPSEISFIYNFSTGEQHGTFWYHSHFLAQYADGLRGALILHDPDDPHKSEYDDEFAVTLSDWHHTTSGVLLPLHDSPNYFGLRPIPDSALVSGFGRYNCTAKPGSKCTPNAPFATYNVKKGRAYRFRIINSAADAFFLFSVDNHKLKVIESEGEYLKPTMIERLPVNVGQRYSVIVRTDQPIGNYWIRGTLDNRCTPINNVTINFNSAIDWNGRAILHYEGADSQEPKSLESTQNITACRDLDPKFLEPANPKGEFDQKPVTDFFNFTVRFQRDDDVVLRALMNESAFVPHFNDPTLNRITRQFPLDQLPANENSLIFDNEGGVVEIAMWNNNTSEHPFHMHGHTFAVMFVGERDQFPDPSKYNTKNPIIRDTVTVPGNGQLVIRFISNNPGIWAYHCHIEWHLEIGMLVQLVELPSKLKERVIPEDVVAACIQYDYEKKKKRSSPTDPTLPAPEHLRRNSVTITEIRRDIHKMK